VRPKECSFKDLSEREITRYDLAMFTKKCVWGAALMKVGGMVETLDHFIGTAHLDTKLDTKLFSPNPCHSRCVTLAVGFISAHTAVFNISPDQPPTGDVAEVNGRATH
jgi:hypothetical protein